MPSAMQLNPAVRQIIFQKGINLARLAVSVAVMENKQVLLTQRDDFHVWCLPSGGVDEGETVAAAALRETREETGLDVKLTGLIGVYSRIGTIPDIHVVHFKAIPIGGEINTQAGETVDVRYFPYDALPNEMIFGHKRRILDSIGDPLVGKLVVHRFDNSIGGPITREELYRLRDESGMSRSDFYMSYLVERWIGDEDFIF